MLGFKSGFLLGRCLRRKVLEEKACSGNSRVQKMANVLQEQNYGLGLQGIDCTCFLTFFSFVLINLIFIL